MMLNRVGVVIWCLWCLLCFRLFCVVVFRSSSLLYLVVACLFFLFVRELSVSFLGLLEVGVASFFDFLLGCDLVCFPWVYWGLLAMLIYFVVFSISDWLVLVDTCFDLLLDYCDWFIVCGWYIFVLRV